MQTLSSRLILRLHAALIASMGVLFSIGGTLYLMDAATRIEAPAIAVAKAAPSAAYKS